MPVTMEIQGGFDWSIWDSNVFLAERTTSQENEFFEAEEALHSQINLHGMSPKPGSS